MCIAQKLSNLNQSGAEEVLRRYQLDAQQIADKMWMYNAVRGAGDE